MSSSVDGEVEQPFAHAETKVAVTPSLLQLCIELSKQYTPDRNHFDPEGQVAAVHTQIEIYKESQHNASARSNSSSNSNGDFHIKWVTTPPLPDTEVSWAKSSLRPCNMLWRSVLCEWTFELPPRARMGSQPTTRVSLDVPYERYFAASDVSSFETQKPPFLVGGR